MLLRGMVMVSGMLISMGVSAGAIPFTYSGTIGGVAPKVGFDSCTATPVGGSAEFDFGELVPGGPSSAHPADVTIEIECTGAEAAGEEQKFAFGLTNYFFFEQLEEADSTFGEFSRMISGCNGTPWDRCASLPVDISGAAGPLDPLPLPDLSKEADGYFYAYFGSATGSLVCNGSNINAVECTMTSTGPGDATGTVTFSGRILNLDRDPIVPDVEGEITPARHGSPALYVDMISGS